MKALSFTQQIVHTASMEGKEVPTPHRFTNRATVHMEDPGKSISAGPAIELGGGVCA